MKHGEFVLFVFNGISSKDTSYSPDFDINTPDGKRERDRRWAEPKVNSSLTNTNITAGDTEHHRQHGTHNLCTNLHRPAGRRSCGKVDPGTGRRTHRKHGTHDKNHDFGFCFELRKTETQKPPPPPPPKKKLASSPQI